MLSARERLKAEVESMLLARNVRPDGGAARIPVASTKESKESTTKGADAHRNPRPPPTPRGLEAPSTPLSQAAGMSHTERLRLMRERRQTAAEKRLHPSVRDPTRPAAVT